MTSHTIAHPLENDQPQSDWLAALGVAVAIHVVLLLAGAFNHSGDSLLDLINQGETLAIAPSDPSAFEQKVFEIDLTPPPPPDANPEFIRPQEVVKKEPEIVKKPIPKPKPVEQESTSQASPYAASGYEAGNKNFPKPPYPYEAKLKRFQGTVVLSLSVSNGAIVNAEVNSSSGYGVLDNTALSWVKKQWKFPSGMTRNLTLPVRFELETASAN